VLVLVVPGSGGWAWGGESAHSRVIRAWSAGLLRVFGFRVRRFGTPLPGAVLFVANHVSWIDIELFHSQLWAGFVSKAEVEKWPLVGWLASLGGTIYHHRGSQDSLHGVMHQMLLRLQQGRPVAVFPEGRATDGTAVGVFHARIFQPALLAGVPVQPVALRYGPGGDAQPIVAFAPGEGFVANFVRLLGEPGRVAEVHFLEPVAPSEDGRRRMAETCRERVVARMAR
ncbi:MAG TPA: 1-acyl-sn-glycerol-3-phosphate acyltransferase, partial [Xanthomonadaceae bacterium]|nr:1-acyl-sn-glycerol-3-phosphate acyltransferase [Xanthomonadaceae bacterium]